MRTAKTQVRLGGGRQADLSLRWAHSHIVGFVMRRLICLTVLLLSVEIPVAHSYPAD